MTGELQRQNGNCSRAENAVDFRERDSRSIWRIKPRLSVVVEFCWLGQGCLLSEKCPSRFVFEILHLPGELPTGKAFENSEASFRKPFAEGGCVDLVTLE